MTSNGFGTAQTKQVRISQISIRTIEGVGMSRFYFHIHAGEQVLLDQEGTELRDTHAARQEALATARDILANAIRSGNENIPEAIVIADSEGRGLETVPFALVLPRPLETTR
jgi:hypothetical protein